MALWWIEHFCIAAQPGWTKCRDDRGKRRLMRELVLSSTLLLGVNSVPSSAIASPEEASTMLEFVAVQDSKCQILSEGGKLSQVRNTQEHRRIKLRLFRVFGNVRQGGPVVVEVEGGQTLPLGCNRVDGREQRWEIINANFAD
jgi:hypothetical protein